MYGKHFASMYTGSMFGAGACVFAVMGYAIANGRPDRRVGMQVELNPKLLAAILGETEADVAAAIKRLCEPDPESRSKEHQGRRLIQLGTFDYQIVNGAKYRAMRDEETRRAQNREAQQRHRQKKAKGKGPLPGERAAVAAMEAGDQETADRIAAQSSRDAEPGQSQK